jgi:hypothetical protein
MFCVEDYPRIRHIFEAFYGVNLKGIYAWGGSGGSDHTYTYIYIYIALDTGVEFHPIAIMGHNC